MPARLTVAEYLDYLRPFYPTWDKALEASIRGCRRVVTASEDATALIFRIVTFDDIARLLASK